jgi:ATP-binding cassette subfamily F protein uup
VPDAPDGRWIEYAGGYSDMLAQRKGAIDERRKAEKAGERAKPQEAAASAETAKGKGKLSYKQKFALENLPKEMAKAEAEIAKREERMADPSLFSKDPTTFNRLAAEMEKFRDSLTKMEEEWLELEMLREELEG